MRTLGVLHAAPRSPFHGAERIPAGISRARGLTSSPLLPRPRDVQRNARKTKRRPREEKPPMEALEGRFPHPRAGRQWWEGSGSHPPHCSQVQSAPGDSHLGSWRGKGFVRPCGAALAAELLSEGLLLSAAAQPADLRWEERREWLRAAQKGRDFLGVLQGLGERRALHRLRLPASEGAGRRVFFPRTCFPDPLASFHGSRRLRHPFTRLPRSPGAPSPPLPAL